MITPPATGLTNDYTDSPATFVGVIRIPLATNPLNLNKLRSMHWAVKGKHTKLWRSFVHMQAKRWPECAHVRVTLTWFVKDKRRRDETNLWGLFKPLADGIVDAGVIADDDSSHLEGFCHIRPAPEGTTTAYMELRVEQTA